MAKRTKDLIFKKSKLVQELVKHHFQEKAKRVKFKPAGKTNFVYEVSVSSGPYIIRISDSPDKINDYLKEQWAIQQAKAEGVPVANILEVGNDIIGSPYMIQEKLDGKEAVDHPDRLEIIKKLGEYAAKIHTIKTKNFGKVFDWSQNKLSKNTTWNAYLLNEYEIEKRLKILQENKMLSSINYKKLKGSLGKIEKWKLKPVLNHGDLRLKNVIVNDKAQIIALIDWENCVSNIAPYWDVSIALHDLSIDAKQQFLEGYNMEPEKYTRISYALKAINILNYAYKIKRMAERKEKENLNQYRLRLNGHYDLFAL